MREPYKMREPGKKINRFFTGNAVDLNCLNQCKNTFTSFPRRRESSFFKIFGIPTLVEMTW